MKQIIGQPLNRKDAQAKVTGKATYAAEHKIANLVHGYLVTASCAKGQIKKINTQKATATEGVIAVFTHENVPSIAAVNAMTYEQRLPLSDNQIHYAGQIVGIVVAETLEIARDAAHQVEVEYETQLPQIEPQKAEYQKALSIFGEDLEFQTGDWTTGNVEEKGATKIEATYTTALEIHAPMEPHALIVDWQGQEAVTIYEPSQWVAGSQKTYSDLFNIAPEQVRIVSPYIGGGFGSKAFPWPHAILTVAVARAIHRPLKLVVSRRQMTANTGHRSHTEQTIHLSADQEGKLIGIKHLAKSCTSSVSSFAEPCTVVTPVMYTAPNIQIKQELGKLNVGSPTFMRGPGETPGMFALESAMDELAWELNIDPVELRLKNETLEHQKSKLPFSEKYFSTCLKMGAEKFGWNQRSSKVRSQGRGDLLVGWGMAASAFPAYRGKATVTVRLLRDKTVEVKTSGNDMGTGAYTVIGMTAAETLQVSPEIVTVKLGDSILPNGGIAGGSQMTATITPAVLAACEKVLEIAKAKNAEEAFTNLVSSSEEFYEATVSAEAQQEKKFAFHSWGAHFCEVTVDEAIARLQVTRWVSVMNIGRVLNTKTAASQIRGGVIMGIGDALMEECSFDPSNGLPVVYDLATYHVPCHADIPRIEVFFVGEPDLNFNPVGGRGVGEIGITGVAAAIANAVYHATGKRIRNLPLTPEKLL